jgi:hypothetical protein
MTFAYRAFGLRLHSNQEIPGFRPVPVEPLFDVEVSLGDFPEHVGRRVPPDEEGLYISPDFGDNGQRTSRVWQLQGGEYFRILYDDGTDCVIDREGRRIWIWWPEPFTVADVVPYLQGQILGFAQRLRGVTCLHASAILVGDRALVLTGPGGAGKSSTAAAFLQLGLPVLADDVVPIFTGEDGFMVRPAHSRLWLRPDMVEALYGSSDALPQFAPSWEKLYLDMNAVPPGQPEEPKPLGAIYLLGDRADEPERPFVADAPRHEAVLELLRNTYVNHLLNPEMRAREFALLTHLQPSVTVRMAHPHTDPSRIDQLCRVILKDFADAAGSARSKSSLVSGAG